MDWQEIALQEEKNQERGMCQKQVTKDFEEGGRDKWVRHCSGVKVTNRFGSTDVQG